MSLISLKLRANLSVAALPAEPFRNSANHHRRLDAHPAADEFLLTAWFLAPRYDIGRITTLLTAGVTLPFYNEYAVAQDAQRRISQPNNNSVVGASTQRPNASGASASVDASFEKRIDGWINPAAFSQASQFSFGNIGRVISLRGPGQISFDVSLFKTFSLMEKLKVQFRAEALNVSNTPTFYGPNTTFTNPQFGIITSQANYPRLIQIGVRFYR